MPVSSLGLVIALSIAAWLPATAASALPHFKAGTYKAAVTDGTTVYHGTWNVTVAAGRIKGLSHWTCCPGKRTDPLEGTVSGTRVVIVRNCTGQGAGVCSQTYHGRVEADGKVTGTWSGSGAGTGTTFVLTPVA